MHTHPRNCESLEEVSTAAARYHSDQQPIVWSIALSPPLSSQASLGMPVLTLGYVQLIMDHTVIFCAASIQHRIWQDLTKMYLSFINDLYLLNTFSETQSKTGIWGEMYKKLKFIFFFLLTNIYSDISKEAGTFVWFQNENASAINTCTETKNGHICSFFFLELSSEISIICANTL